MLTLWTPTIALLMTSRMHDGAVHHALLHDALLSGVKSIDALHRVAMDMHTSGRRPGSDLQLDKWEESDEAYQLTIDVPGLRVGDLTATLEQEGDSASVALVGETKTQHRHSKIARWFTLPANTNHDTVSVAVADGLLTVKISKRTPMEPQRLPISTDGGDEGEEDDAAYHATVLVPGVRAEDLTVTLEDDGMLVIEGEASRRRSSRIHRRLKMPRDTDFAATSCSLMDGVLAVTMPKREPEKKEPRELVVQSCLPEECG
jgi:HSP20 family molecular chaperone IbpA